MRNLAWAAGLFEGEGCITFGVSSRNDTLTSGASVRYENGQVRLVLAMTDQDIVEDFARIVGVGSVNRIHPPSKRALNNKPQWRWQTSGEHAEALFWKLAPYLGPRRQEQFFEAKNKLSIHREAKQTERRESRA